jgi:hypothetical protein
VNTHLCIPPLYEYEYNGRTWRFEYQPIGPPYWPVRKNGKPYARLPPDGSEFWNMLARWGAEPDWEKYRVG